jgi:pyrimidine operon attenuation protein / uracil phosphoribosyltransferase
MNTVVLTRLQINQKLQRIAYEIIENHSEDHTIYLIGIKGNGSLIAEELKGILSGISSQQFITGEVSVNKQEPWASAISCTISSAKLENNTVILIDDVLNSGKTMQYALIKLLDQPVTCVKTVALVDRMHRRFPIKCDYAGVTLSTTLQERVDVILGGEKTSAYLV